MKGRLVIGVVGVAVVAIALILLLPSLITQQTTYKPAIELPQQRLPSFTLIDQYGREFSLDSVKGKAVLLYFGYTNCPDVCPLVMARYKYVLEKLRDDADKVALLFITVDPERDTPEVMREYASKFDERIIMLTGSKEQLKKVWDLYNIKPLKQGAYVAHFALVMAADKNLITRFAFTPEMSPDEYLQGIRYLLSQ